jgi:regulator of telomere elongation helicase 1
MSEDELTIQGRKAKDIFAEIEALQRELEQDSIHMNPRVQDVAKSRPSLDFVSDFRHRKARIDIQYENLPEPREIFIEHVDPKSFELRDNTMRGKESPRELNKIPKSIFVSPKMKSQQTYLVFEDFDNPMKQQGSIRVLNNPFKVNKRTTGDYDADMGINSKRQIPTFFPFEPYETQKGYMETVMQALIKRENAILESPTGTGKTLSLLAACLGFLKYEREVNKNADIQLIYTSRTHSQLKQAIKELKKTVFQPEMITLGSRDFLCVNSDLKYLSGGLKKTRCKMLMTVGGCKFNENFKKGGFHIPKKVIDIEEFNNIMREQKVCGFHVSKRKADSADIIFMPYNYVFDESYRSNHVSLFANSIIIFDEAHNLESVAEEGSSTSFSTSDIDELEKELRKFVEIQTARGQPSMRTAIVDILHCMANLKEGLIRYFTTSGQTEIVKKGEEMIQIIEKFTKGEFTLNATVSKDGNRTFGNNRSNIYSFLEPGEVQQERTHNDTMNNQRLDPVANNLQNFRHGINCENLGYMLGIFENIKDIASSNEPKIDQERIQSETIARFKQSFALIYNLWKNYEKSRRNIFADNDFEHFRTVVELTDNKQIRLRLMCLNPFYSFKSVIALKPHSMIVTSGTLSPMDVYEADLRVHFRYKFQGKHVINSFQQLYCSVLEKLPSKELLNMTFKNRKNDTMYAEVGEVIYDVLKVVPEGVLVFFNSYASMNNFMAVWRQKSLLQKMGAMKKVFVESKSANEQEKLVSGYMETHQSGAVFFAVCGGKLSEGFDFADSMARCVVVVGIPYPNITDKYIESKREYLDQMKCRSTPGKTMLDSNTWYQAKALRTTNQAIGRVIRHSKDYGAILLFDNRFAYKGVEKLVSSWARDVIKVSQHPSQMVTELKTFFANCRRQFPTLPVHEIERGDDFQSSQEVDGQRHFQDRETLRDLITTINDYSESQISNRAIIPEPIQRIESIRPSRQKSPPTIKTSNKVSAHKLDSTDKIIERLERDRPSKKIYQSTLRESFGFESAHKSIVAERPLNQTGEDGQLGIKCKICFEPDLPMFTSRCGHLACEDCWTTFIKTNHRCFMCRKPIKSKAQLTKVFI